MLRALIGFALLYWSNQCYAAKYFIAAPNLLRVGVEETVSISVFDVDGDVDIQLSLQDYPKRRRTFSQVSGTFGKQKPGLLKIKVNAKDLPYEKSLGKQYVYLRARSNTPGFQFSKEIRILVSYRNTMVFIQTDKPIYNPGHTVNLRVVPLGFDLKASMNNVTIEILNPQGVRVQRWGNLNTNEGFFSRRLDLSYKAMLGLWTVRALYGHGRIQNASIQFEVREYILPTFSVKLEGPPYILETDPSITIKITSKYTYGKAVLGSVQVNLAVLDDAGKAERFSTSIHTLRNGVADVVISTDLLKAHAKIPWFPDGKRLVIEAKVVEQATGQEEKALDNTIYFTNTPLKISFKRSPRFFKPGVPFEIKIDVTYMNGKAAKDTALEFDAETDKKAAVLESKASGRVSEDNTNELGQGRFVVDVPKTFDISYLDITVRATISQGGRNITSEGRFQPKMYQSNGRNYLFVRFLSKPKVGESVDAEAFVLSSGSSSSLTYMVVANGKVVFQGQIDRNLGVLTTIKIRVTSAMMPMARFVAYYHVNNELVVDSTIMEVEEELPNQVSFLNKNHLQVLPGEPQVIKVQGSPHSNIGIVAVDQSVYLLRNDKHLTHDEVYRRMKSHDLGCGSGAGRNNRDVLSRGGLAVMSDSIRTYTRTEYSCASYAKRKRRSADPTCCLFGEELDPGTCLARAKNFSVSNISSLFHPRDACVIAFYKCCFKKFEMDWRRRSGDVDVPNDLLNDIDFIDEELLQEILEDNQVRTHFPETWLFEQMKAGKDGRASFRVTVPDTITTWVMQAIAVSNTTGFGLTPPFNLKSFKSLFVSIKLPYSAQRGEQVSVIATVYNYRNMLQTVAVHLFKKPGENYCTYSKGTSLYEVQVDPNGAASVAFPIVPTELGDIPIEVRIIATRTGEGDGERRTLKVLPEGIERRVTHSLVLDPLDVLRDLSDANASVTAITRPTTRKRGYDGQRDQISLKLPNSTIPASEYAFLTVIGNLIGSPVSNIIEGEGLEHLFRKIVPTDCGEQTMSKLAPLVHVFNYLRSTKQVTKETEESAFRHMLFGYQHELTHRTSENAFSIYKDEPSRPWLTAYVIKTFCAIQRIDGIDIDQNVINLAMDWLARQQRADGSIAANDRSYIGATEMTAYVLTAFIECARYSPNSGQTARRAVAYLENALPNVGSTYVKAVIAYALALADSPQKLKANRYLLDSANYDPVRNTRYWNNRQGSRAGRIITTSYVLLTQMVLNRIAYAGPIVLWLTEQKNGGGYFASTKDTAVALQALAAYSEATAGREQINLHVEVFTDRAGAFKKTLIINQKNALIQQQLDITNLIGDELFIETKGAGVAQLQVETRYNTPRTEKEECQFNLSVTTIERVKRMYDQPIIVAPKPTKSPKKKKPKAKKPKCRRKDGKKCRSRKPKCKGRRCKGKKRQKGGRRNKPQTTTTAPQHTTRPPPNDGPVTNSISIKICTRFKKAGESAGMSIIDVGILTGFSVKQESLVELKEKVEPGISHYEVSDRHAILYIDEILSEHELCYNLELTRDFAVGIVQPVPVTVYDYYEPDNKCTKFYGPEPDSRLNLATCEHDSCRCDLDKCSSCKTSDNADYVKKLLCTRYNYGFKGKLLIIDEKDQWLHLTFDIVEVYKESSTKKITRETKRIVFSRRTSCKCPEFAGKTDRHFLIMGKDLGLQGSSKIVLGQDVFVKSWPSKDSNFFKKFIRLLRNGC